MKLIFCRKGIFPAASFMSYQHVLFNFGKDNFKYPPSDIEFKNFNKHGVLPDEKKYVLPRYCIYFKLSCFLILGLFTKEYFN